MGTAIGCGQIQPVAYQMYLKSQRKTVNSGELGKWKFHNQWRQHFTDFLNLFQKSRKDGPGLPADAMCSLYGHRGSVNSQSESTWRLQFQRANTLWSDRRVGKHWWVNQPTTVETVHQKVGSQWQQLIFLTWLCFFSNLFNFDWKPKISKVVIKDETIIMNL